MTSCPPHRYLLSDPVAGTVAGRCRACGAERTWSSYTSTDYDARTASQRAAAAVRGGQATRLRTLADDESEDA